MIYLPYDPGDYVGMLVSEPAAPGPLLCRIRCGSDKPVCRSGRLYRCVEVREETTSERFEQPYIKSDGSINSLTYGMRRGVGRRR